MIGKGKKRAVSDSIALEPSFWDRVKVDFAKNKVLYLLVLPVIVYYIIFHYLPMYGVIIAFKDYKPALGFTGSPWVGLKHFSRFFNGVYFGRLIRNTLKISLSSIIFGFPCPIILALLMNEVRNKHFLKTVQTITYLPHFISLVVVCGIIQTFTSTNGLITKLIQSLTGNPTSLLMRPESFIPLYVGSNIWTGIGWDSILYLAALSGIDQQLYEACEIDGGGRIRQLIHVTLPGIIPTIVIMFILRMGNVLSVGYEKIILLYNQSIYETADVISTYTYRVGLEGLQWSYGAAVSLFNSVINIIVLLTVNKISRRVAETSLW